MVASDGVCRIALTSRFRSTLISSLSEPCTVGQRGSADAVSAMPRRRAAGAAVSIAWATNSSVDTGPRVSAKAPALIRDSSNRSSTIVDSRVVSELIFLA